MKNKSMSVDEWAAIKLIATDFDGVLTDNCVWTFTDGTEAVKTNKSDFYYLDTLKTHGCETVIFTQEKNECVKMRAEKLNIPLVNCLWGKEKFDYLKRYICGKGLMRKQVCYIGNDIPDNVCLAYAGIGVVPCDGEAESKQFADVVCPINGGNGVLRWVCKMVLNAKIGVLE